MNRSTMAVYPFYILCDASSSMSTEDMQAVNEGIAEVIELLTSDPIWNAKVRISIVTYSDNAEVLVPMTTDNDFTHLRHITVQSGAAQFGNLFRFMKFLLTRDCRSLAKSQAAVCRPLIFHISKGRPGDEGWLSYFERLMGDDFVFRPNIVSYGVRGADKDVLASIACWGRSKKKFWFMASVGVSPGPLMAEIIRYGDSTDDYVYEDGDESSMSVLDLAASWLNNYDIVIDDL